MNIPPAPDSPKHILNILIDDCIVEIFRRISTFEDILNAAEVCKRFKKCAMDVRFKFKSIAIDNQTSPINVPAFRAPTLLCNYGSSIKSIDWKCGAEINPKFYDRIFELIAQFCGKTLKNLIFSDFYLYNPKRSENHPFSALERLELNNLAYGRFLSRKMLKHRDIVRLICLEKPWFIRQFPSLQIVHFDEITVLGTEMLTEFLSLNPQLQVLKLSVRENVNEGILKSIGKYTTNLHTLDIGPILSYYRMNENVLKALRKLRKLRLTGEY